jgi:hypothetical protein
MSARDIWLALGGKRHSEREYLVPCPCAGHGRGRGDKNPSCRIADGDHAILVYCYAGCPREDVLSALRAKGLLESSKSNFRPQVVPIVTPCKTVEIDPAAAAFWETCSPARFTPVETYLRRRCIDVCLPACIRFQREKYQGEWLPVMVSAVQDNAARVIATQRTYLTWSGEKAPVEIPRRTEGRMLRGAVRLSRISKATKVIGLAEGVETAMSASEAWGGLPVWATLGAARLDKIELPEQIEEVHIYADYDDAGRNAATAAKSSYAPRRVIIRTPPADVDDWNQFQVLRRLKAAASA